MDGEKVRLYLKENGITAQSVADSLEIKKQTISAWLKSGTLSEPQRSALKKALKLPTNFFDHSFNQVGEGNVSYGTTSAALAECQKERAVLEERVAQLTARLAEKDSTIRILTKQLK